MVEVIREQEQPPATWPDKPSGLSTKADALAVSAVWSRLEHWITYRWAQRSVTWYTRGAGVFHPRLRPATLDTAEIWADDNWQTTTLTDGPFGYQLSEAPHKLTFTVGSTETPPDTVLLAYTRLAEFWAEAQGDMAGATSITDGDFSMTRSANIQGRALQYSGAADLLRGLR